MKETGKYILGISVLFAIFVTLICNSKSCTDSIDNARSYTNVDVYEKLEQIERIEQQELSELQIIRQTVLQNEQNILEIKDKIEE